MYDSLMAIMFGPKKMIFSKQTPQDIASIDLGGEVLSQCTEKKEFKQVLERHDGVLGFTKTKFYFEKEKVDQKLANGLCETSYMVWLLHNLEKKLCFE